jgi:hypothetical protein
MSKEELATMLRQAHQYAETYQDIIDMPTAIGLTALNPDLVEEVINNLRLGRKLENIPNGLWPLYMGHIRNRYIEVQLLLTEYLKNNQAMSEGRVELTLIIAALNERTPRQL